MDQITYRPAQFSDWENIAQLHADSWEKHYRGSFSDAYLDGPVYEDRRQVWKEKFTDVPAEMRLLLAERDAQLLGFVCYLLDEDPKLGTYINNLHVSTAAQNQGIGASLLRQASANAKKETAHGRMYLYVLTVNTAAIRFYERFGGKIIKREMHDHPDGGAESAEVFTIAWENGVL